ncbi:terpene synthase family protein [Streptomyces spectabilis]|uniref:terpene synthase family protein n=1 Tax=Streptomyces spectabilis TaxID=68270 RepID=UPI0033F01C28
MPESLPAFRYPRHWAAPRLNPLSRGMTARSLDWAAEMGLAEHALRGLDAMGSGLNPGAFAGCIHPHTGNAELLQISSDFALWITIMDDAVEHLSPRIKHEERAALFADCTRFYQQHLPAPHTVLDPYRRGYTDLGQRLERLVPPDAHPTWRERFQYELIACNRSAVMEEPRASAEWKGPEFYEQIRPFTPGVLPFMPLMEIADDCLLPPHVVRDPRLARVEELACVIFGHFNDVASLDKDDRKGEPVPNIVLMHQHAHRGTVAESVAAVARRHNTLVGQLRHRIAELVANHPHDAELVQRYTRSVQNLVTGIAYWHLHALRYGERFRSRARLEHGRALVR